MRDRTYHAACICGTVRFAVDAIPKLAMPCICPRCRGQGLRIVHVDQTCFRLLVGEDMLTEPMDAARDPHHFFCRRCGEAVFGFVDIPNNGRRVTVNVACLNRGSVDDISVSDYDVVRPGKWEL